MDMHLMGRASVTDFAAVQAMVREALDAWGRVDIPVNRAGILRDRSFAKMDLADFALVTNVHRMGATRMQPGSLDNVQTLHPGVDVQYLSL